MEDVQKKTLGICATHADTVSEVYSQSHVANAVNSSHEAVSEQTCQRYVPVHPGAQAAGR